MPAVIVEGDPVEGTDRHNVSGQTASSPPVAYAGIGEFDYAGAMTDALSGFVRIDGQPVALITSRSALNPGEAAVGGHWAAAGSNYTPPPPNAATLVMVDAPIGEGAPSLTAGSRFVSIDGDAVLLDGDAIDTCDGLGIPMNSTVSSSGQSFVVASE